MRLKRYEVMYNSSNGETQTNYFHTCLETTQCDCGWRGCLCKTSYSTKKIDETTTELNQLCPNCKRIVSTIFSRIGGAAYSIIGRASHKLK